MSLVGDPAAKAGPLFHSLVILRAGSSIGRALFEQVDVATAAEVVMVLVEIGLGLIERIARRRTNDLLPGTGTPLIRR
jgi:hypothetical protein